MNDLRGRTVVVTGAGGFIGRHLVDRLLQNGAAVIAWQRRPHPLPPTVQAEIVDVSCGSAVRRAAAGRSIDTVVHVASAVARVDDLRSALADAALLGNLLDVYADDGFGHIVALGSAAQYGRAAAPQSETMRVQPLDWYGVAKTVCDVLAEHTAAVTGRRVTVLRPFSVFGEGQPRHMFLAQLIHACVRGDTFTMSRGTQVRDFVYVGDLCDAIIRAIQCPDAAAGVFNVGTGVGTALWDVALRAVTLARSDARLIRSEAVSMRGSAALVADIHRIREALDWQPTVGLDEGLAAMIDHERRQR